jgi:ankyrin repeat protein
MEDITSLQTAAYFNDVESLERLLAQGLEIDGGTEDYGGWTALIEACNNDSYEAAIFLLEHGADVNRKSQAVGSTALHFCAGKENIALLEALLQHGADVNASNNWGHSPLHWCATTAAAQLLLDQGADLDATDSGDRTPLHYACINKRYDVIRLLLERGADSAPTDATDATGKTAFDYLPEERRADFTTNNLFMTSKIKIKLYF